MDIAESTALDLLTERLKDKQVWKDLVSAFDDVVRINVDEPIRELEFLRFLPPGTDSAVASEICRMLGFDLSQDVLNMSTEKFVKLASQLGMYPDTNGTEDFTKFISLMTNGTCTIDSLWSNDYVNFYQEPQGSTIEYGGAWFKTTHVNLNMGFSTLEGLQLKPGQTLGERIVEIFYQQAPAALVIATQTFTVDIPCQEVGVGVHIAGVERIYSEQCAGGEIL